MMASNAAMASGVTTPCAWSGQGQSVTKLMPFTNFLVHLYTCCSDRHASPKWTSNHQWISMGFTPSLLKKMEDRTMFFLVHAVSRTAIFTLLVCHCVAFLHHTATRRPPFKPWVSCCQAVFQIFIALLRFSFDSPSYYTDKHKKRAGSSGKADGPLYNCCQ
jgi:hypothetical protein